MYRRTTVTPLLFYFPLLIQLPAFSQKAEKYSRIKVFANETRFQKRMFKKLNILFDFSFFSNLFNLSILIFKPSSGLFTYKQVFSFCSFRTVCF